MTVFVSDLDNLTIHDLGFVELPSGVKISKLSVWDHCEGVFARRGWRAAQKWAESRGMRLPTVAEYRELEKIALHIAPYPMPTAAMLKAAGIPRRDTRRIDVFRNTNMSSLEWAKLHDAAVFNRLRKAGHTDEPVFNDGKHHAAGGLIFGWDMAEAQGQIDAIQGASTAHVTHEQVDYATTFHVVIDSSGEAIPPPDSLDDAVIVEIDTEPPPSSDPHPEPSNLGERGAHVILWQRYLISYFLRRHDVQALPTYGADGDHGGETEEWSRKWGDDDPSLLINVLVDTQWDEPPVNAGLRCVNFTPADRGSDDIKLCVMHSIQSPVIASATLNSAMWFAGKAKHKGLIVEPPQASIHWWAGPTDESVLHTLEERHVAWGAKGGNRFGVHIEQTGYTANPSRGIEQTDWLDEGLPVLERSSWVARGVCERNGIPIVWLTPNEIAGGKSGLCSHWGVTAAFAVSGGHYDPGGKHDAAWPIEEFLEMVRAH